MAGADEDSSQVPGLRAPARRRRSVAGRRVAVFGAATLAVVGGLAVVALLRTPPRIDNLILLSVDALRADRVGVYGSARPTTPHLDALAARSVVFLDAVTQYTSTRYSHAALFDGRYPFRKGRGPTLAQILSASGFRTAAFTGGGKMHAKFGFARGFEVYDDSTAYGGLADVVAKARAWLDGVGDQRFFLLLHTYDVHCPYDPPEPYFSMFLEGRQPRFPVARKCGNNYFNRAKLGRRDYEVLGALYDCGVRAMDEELGALLDDLSARGLLERTLVVVLSDHGEALGERGFVGHGHVSDAEVAVPLVLSIPGEGAARIDAPVQLVDVLPTVADYLGVPAPEVLDGRSLRPLVEGGEPADGRVRVTLSPLGEKALFLDRRWKLELDADGDVQRLVDRSSGDDRDVRQEHPEIVAVLVGAAGQLFADGGAMPPDFETDELGPQLEEQLRSLGYVE